MDSARFAQIEETCQALRRIRDGRLYREKYATFEEYVEKKWSADILTILAEWEAYVRERN
jgi:hypothetical protein